MLVDFRSLVYTQMLGLFLALHICPAQDNNPEDLQKLSPQQLLSLIDHKPEPFLRNAAILELLKKREDSIPFLRQVALTSTERQRLLALKLLAEMNDANAVSLAIVCLHDTSIKIQTRAALVLMRMKDSVAFKPLIDVLQLTKDSGLIKSVVVALGAIGNTQAIPALRPYLSHENVSVQVNTAIALAMLGSNEGLSFLLSGLTSSDLQAQREAAFGLGYFSSPRARAAAEAIINNATASWQSEAHIALARLDLLSSQPAQRLHLLKQFVDHQNHRVATWAVDALFDLGTQEGLDTIRKIAMATTPAGRYASTKLMALGYKP